MGWLLPDEKDDNERSSMLYFTSDLHLGHDNAIEFTNRPFSTVDEMNLALVQNINETVGTDDELWILGDFSFK